MVFALLVEVVCHRLWKVGADGDRGRERDGETFIGFLRHNKLVKY
jgi:hypothetical protein